MSGMAAARHSTAFACAAFALCLISASGAQSQSEDPYAALNSVRVTLEADRDTISVTERVRLTLTI